MGTNYYVETVLGRTHVGKSSAGWCFSLHVTENIRSLDEWISCLLWAKNTGGKIVDEYGKEHSLSEFLIVVIQRSPDSLRHDIDGRHCVGHGPGRWDLLEGEFS